MNKYIAKIYTGVLVIGLLYAVIAGISFQNQIYTRTENQKVSVWDDRMEQTRDGNTYYYKTILPENVIDGKTIVYNTVHMYLQVHIDGKKVYELKPRENSRVKTTGFCWNTITLTAEDAGKEIVFQVKPAYTDSRPGGSFLYGTYQDIEFKILKEHIIQLLLAAMILLAGIVMLVYGYFVVKKGQDTETLIQFSIFTILLGIWSACETQILDIYFPGSLMMVFVTHLTLMAMPVPFVLFLRRMYHNGKSRWWDFCCYLNCAVSLIRVGLQVTGKYDLRETLFLTHLSILALAVIVVGISIHEIFVHRATRQIRLNSICVIVILISTLLELGIYRIYNRSTSLGSLGFLIYIVIMGLENVHKSRKLMERAKESEIYRKLAFTDELTGLYNRTAFSRDMENRAEPDSKTGRLKILPTVIYMFDLNDLKKCNDTYGHEFGDQYIMMAADVLQKIFMLDGRCYRIGGDEFCALVTYKSRKEINEKMNMLERLVKEKNKENFVVPVSIAAGYAVYRENNDVGLDETMKRADEMMYEKKQEYKRQKASA